MRLVVADEHAQAGTGRITGHVLIVPTAGRPGLARKPGVHGLREDPRIVLALLKINSHVAYIVVFALVATESSGVPLPGETALIAAGVLASHGRVHIELVIALAALGAIVGDNIGYAIGRTGGRRLLERPGFLEEHRRRVLEEGEPFFKRHGAKAVFLGRWVSGLRIAAAWLAGINRMPWPKFLVWNAVGGVTWVVTVGLAAYYIGHKAESAITALGLVGLLGLVIALVGHGIWTRRLSHPGGRAAGRP